MALGDLFNDGHQEALVNNMNEAPSLYYNTAPVWKLDRLTVGLC